MNTPNTANQNAADLKNIYADVESRRYDAKLIAPFGAVGITHDDKAVTGIYLLLPSAAGKTGHVAIPPKINSLAHLACVQLMAYFDNPRYVFDLPIRLFGSKHQLDVWQAMRDIPAGKTHTYGEIATIVGSSPRAVGTACGKNPLPIVVPCHRIVAANGLGGFMGVKGKGGDSKDANLTNHPLALKRWLLNHER